MEKRIIGENLILIFHTKFNILPLVKSFVISKNFDFEYARNFIRGHRTLNIFVCSFIWMFEYLGTCEYSNLWIPEHSRSLMNIYNSNIRTLEHLKIGEHSKMFQQKRTLPNHSNMNAWRLVAPAHYLEWTLHQYTTLDVTVWSLIGSSIREYR